MININDLNYHIGKLDKDDIKYVISIIDKTIKKYPDLFIYIKNVFSFNGIILNDLHNNELLVDIFTAFIHSLKDNEDIKNEEQLLKKIKGYIRNYLETIFSNRKYFIGSHQVQYEPKMVALLAFSNYVNREFSTQFDNEHDQLDEFEQYAYIELINMFRTIKSSLALFTIGDDVHAIALFRGYVEIASKIMLADNFKEDYVAFKKYNGYLQAYKSKNGDIPEEMKERLGKNATNENYLAYGWAKNKNGKRITTMTDLIRLAFGKSMDVAIHISSEFVHEDYVNVGYDFVALRKIFINTYFETINMLLDEWDFDEIKISRFLNLFKNV